MLGHTASIYSLSFSNESSLLVSGGADWTVRCWDVKSSGGLVNRGMRENGIANGVNGATEGLKDHADDEAVETYVMPLFVFRDINLE